MKPKFSIVAIALLLAVLLFGCSTPRKLAGSTKETAKTEEKRDETTAAGIRRAGGRRKQKWVWDDYFLVNKGIKYCDTKGSVWGGKF